MQIKKALLSVSDKTGIVNLAQILTQNGVEIISTGGTKTVLETAGISVTDISDVTGNPEAFGGRMKTISFQIESALLFDREKDAVEALNLQIAPIDLVVCNLYPFAKVLSQGADFDTLIENIDIGGPTMLRAAAKNFKYVVTLTQPADYDVFVSEFVTNKGATTFEFRKLMMAKAFNHTADYDALIAQTMDKSLGIESLRLAFENGKTLRYGENSHQNAMFYREKGVENTFHDMEILHGKELSYNNILDISGAVNSINELSDFACSIIKHSNPCGLAQGENQRKALETAWQADPISAFGSIIAFNQKVSLSTAQFFELTHEDKTKRKFIEVIIAPDYEPEALVYLQNHKDLRILKYHPEHLPENKDLRFINGTLLSQDYDQVLYEKMDVVTIQVFDLEKYKELIAFGLKAIKNIKSNAIAVVGIRHNQCFLMGMGAGQPNRLISTELALRKAEGFLKAEFNGKENDFPNYYQTEISKAILISDAFFPFADNVEMAFEKGIKTIVQPGGSIRDKSVIEKCNELKINMIFTGIRHFKH